MRATTNLVCLRGRMPTNDHRSRKHGMLGIDLRRYGVELPLVGDALEGVAAAVGEDDAGPGHEVLYGARDQDLAGACHRRNARADVHGDAAHIVAPQLDLTGVQSGPDRHREHLAQRRRAADGARWTVEGGEQAVARGLDQPALVALELG